MPVGARAGEQDLTQYVDPFIGTLGAGFVFPGPAAPFGMVQLSPDTEGPFAYTGYQYSDRNIRGFSHVHTQSMGVREGGEIPFMPTVGDIVTDVSLYESPFSHALEEAAPGYYAVELLRYRVRAELTAGMRVGMHRYSFPSGERANVLIDVGRTIGGIGLGTVPGSMPAGAIQADVSIDAAEQTVSGTAVSPRYGTPVHFVARFDRGFASSGVWDTQNAPARPGVATASGSGAGAYVSFDTATDDDVVVKVGLSYVSQANAALNLESELAGNDFGFQALRARTRNAWNRALNAIVVEGGTELQKRSFYTALYHAQHHPNVFNDVNGDYRGYDGDVHNTAGAFTYYANYSFWDTYRAEMPLLMLIAPDRIPDMMRSLAKVVEQGGRLPRWGWMARYADFMNGEPGLQVVADAHCRGLVPNDALETLYADAARLALRDRRDAEYLSVGYTAEASKTLEHALGDFALALMADDLGRTDDRDVLLEQARSWRNVFDAADTRFVRPRNPANGAWRTPYFPEMPDGFREGTGWQYTWLVSHDVRGLFDAMGQAEGDAFVRRRLDTFFAGALAGEMPGAEAQQKNTAYSIAYYGNQYAPSNEHDLQAPWMYNWIGEPHKTQHLQRAYQGLYRATPDGLPGNDDLGTMSAWFIWSALGFYPVTPGSPTYTVGSPMFERATIRLAGGSFDVHAPGAGAARFLAAATLGDEPLERLWFSHDAFRAGGKISFAMSPVPTSWGSDPAARPPSQSTDTDLSAFACNA